MPSSIGWKDLIIPGDQQRPGASAPTFAVWIGTIYRNRYAAGSDHETFFTWHINHDYRPGTDVFMHVHWSPSTTNTGNIVWAFDWTYASGYNTATFPAITTTRIIQAAPGIVNRHMIAESAAVTIPNLETDGLICVRAYREGTNVLDTFTGNAWSHTFDLHYQADHDMTLNRNRNGAAPFWNPLM